ncbi:MAG: hypothetical protein AAGC46_09410 [Solirubrobacteraceae bacterium]|nr:hypothetical protein [Patulibacter sp.]
MSAPVSASTPPLSAEEAEAIATAVALHHLRASQAGAAGGSGNHEDRFSNWARESLLTSMDKQPHRMTAWGVRSWG